MLPRFHPNRKWWHFYWLLLLTTKISTIVVICYHYWSLLLLGLPIIRKRRMVNPSWRVYLFSPKNRGATFPRGSHRVWIVRPHGTAAVFLWFPARCLGRLVSITEGWCESTSGIKSSPWVFFYAECRTKVLHTWKTHDSTQQIVHECGKPRILEFMAFWSHKWKLRKLSWLLTGFSSLRAGNSSWPWAICSHTVVPPAPRLGFFMFERPKKMNSTIFYNDIYIFSNI